MASENKPVKQEVDVYDAEKAKNYKLIVDPQIKRGQEKLVRFDGCIFSSKVSPAPYINLHYFYNFNFQEGITEFRMREFKNLQISGLIQNSVLDTL